jgi:hypothetical protein
MRIVVACLFLAATFAVAIALGAGQRTLNELRAANLSLQRQVEARAGAPDPAPASESPAPNPVAALTPQEQNELLRLRGQIQPLRQELTNISNRLSCAWAENRGEAARGQR